MLSPKHVVRLILYGIHINLNDTGTEIMSNVDSDLQIIISDVDDKFLCVYTVKPLSIVPR
jgi:hypothetical protein